MSNIDPAAFHEFELKGWEEVASRYQDSWASVTTQAVDDLLDAAGVETGLQVLDVACGPGYVAAAAAERGATAAGIDFSAEMVEGARRRYPSIRFEKGDAEQLAFPETSFDAVVLNFGMLHLARPELALAEGYRVLRKGGKLAFTVWDTPDKAVAFGIVLAAIRRHGTLDVQIPAGPPFFRFSDPAESRHVMASAGFTGTKVTNVPQVWRLPAADALFDVMYNGSVRNAALLRAQTPEALKAIEEEISREVAALGNQLPMPAVLVSGTK